MTSPPIAQPHAWTAPDRNDILAAFERAFDERPDVVTLFTTVQKICVIPVAVLAPGCGN